MKLIGITLRKPSFNETTAAVIMGVGLWLALLGLTQALHFPMDRSDAGALLVVSLWGCLCVRVGINVAHGGKHILAQTLVGAMLLGVYNSAWALAALMV